MSWELILFHEQYGEKRNPDLLQLTEHCHSVIGYQLLIDCYKLGNNRTEGLESLREKGIQGILEVTERMNGALPYHPRTVEEAIKFAEEFVGGPMDPRR